MKLNNVNSADFLKTVWQKKHAFIAQAIPDYEIPLDENDLAGLSLEEDAESRIFIQHDNQQWEVQYGPFAEDHYQSLPEKNWTLLIQAVDHWLPEINDLKQYFRFIPDWRIDDIMISYAPTGGGVGPHFDQYDVFLLQAKGERLWKIGQQCNAQSALVESTHIKQLAQFEEQTQYHCKTGDILYIPPGCAHWGISESDDCMTISIGFRAPSHEQIIAHSCDEIASTLTEDLRFKDKNLQKQSHPAKIEASVATQLQAIIEQHLLDEHALITSFGKLMTQVKYPDQFEIYPCDSDLLLRRPEARLAYFVSKKQILLFANGDCVICPLDDELFIQYLADNEEIVIDTLTVQQQNLVQTLCKLGVYQEAE